MERFTISLDEHLAEAFDQWIAQRGYANRSEAVRDLFRAELERSRQAVPQGLDCVASLSYVYNHHERELGERLTRMHHAHHDLSLSTMHVHLDHDHCLETVLLRGRAEAVRAFADSLCAERGVHHGKLNLISVEAHHHHHHGDPRQPHIHVKPAT
jgi:CopG family transcriptional regulator, nickel-responsive regulator